MKRLSRLNDLLLGGDAISDIRCYLTGENGKGDTYNINRYLLSDKHGYTRHVFNAKVNIYREKHSSIYMGLQGNTLTDFGISLVIVLIQRLSSPVPPHNNHPLSFKATCQTLNLFPKIFRSV